MKNCEFFPLKNFYWTWFVLLSSIMIQISPDVGQGKNTVNSQIFITFNNPFYVLNYPQFPSIQPTIYSFVEIILSTLILPHIWFYPLSLPLTLKFDSDGHEYQSMLTISMFKTHFFFPLKYLAILPRITFKQKFSVNTDHQILLSTEYVNAGTN